MEAHLLRAACLVAALLSLGASYRTANFVVDAPTADAAQQIGQAAERYRKELALDWLGHEMPNWAQPCPVTAQVADHLGAGGATSFVFEHGEVFGWRMNIQGSLTRILDSVLPHEVTHTVFATHFRQPLPRWADEGACTTVEHPSEKNKQQTMLIEFLRTNRGIAFSRMFIMKEYPRDVMPLYSQGYSVARYLVGQGGRQKFLEFLADGMRDENWSRATQQFYGIGSLASLQNNWLDWVRKGSPALDAAKPAPAAVAVKTAAPLGRRQRPEANLIHRGQSPDPSEFELAARTSAETRPSSVYEIALAPQDSVRPGPASPDDAWQTPRPDSSAQPEEQRVDENAAKSESAGESPRPRGSQRAGQVILQWSRADSEAGARSDSADRAAAPSYR
jgi:hypothetical protein